jgi:hypothetical protein
MHFRVAFCFLACSVLASGFAAEELRFESGEKQTKLIELFTSEGCSSCPAAEAWLSKLKSDSGLWKDFVPVAFHVNYWDHLGWRDRFASPASTKRQRDYAVRSGIDSVYTPEFVVNGSEWRGWSSHPNVATVPPENAGKLSVETLENNILTIMFHPSGAHSFEWDAHIALLGCGISSRIGAGENSGRQLQHDFVVLEQKSQPMTTTGEATRADITIDLSGKEVVPQKAIAVWITRHNQLQTLQATGGWLSLGKIALPKQN